MSRRRHASADGLRNIFAKVRVAGSNPVVRSIRNPSCAGVSAR
jgi:hypothetical protein